MYVMVTIRGVKVIAKRENEVRCEQGARVLDVPSNMLWNEDELVEGGTCDLYVRKSWALANEVAYEDD